MSLNQLFLSGCLALFPLFAGAQEPLKSALHPCGTQPYTDPWLQDYLRQPQHFAQSRSDDTLYVGLQIHLLARDNGQGRFSAASLLDAFCQLNEDFAPSRVQFYFKNDWNYINNTAWYDHDELTTGIQMMFENNVPDALNIYFVTDPAGNCGYNIPYAGIAMAHGCSGPNDHTWTHEIGHALTLQHTFIGWEGKIYNINTPTPDTLTYDYTHFHPTPDTIVPAPLDTALVEYVDGSNCAIAADKFCDTPPDYLAYRWDCDANGRSLVKQKDPDGAEFYSDGTLYMSYANDNCSNRFSDDQILALRANLLSVKQPWLAPAAPADPALTDTPVLLSPLNGATAPALGAVLHWQSMPGATHYVVQASRFSNYIVREVEEMTGDTFLTCGQLAVNRNYYWRVRPFNPLTGCTDFSANGQFLTSAATLTDAASDADWRCYPTLLEAGQALTLELPESWVNQKIQCRVYNAAGRQVWSSELTVHASVIQLDNLPATLPGGAYRFTIQSAAAIRVQTLLIK